MRTSRPALVVAVTLAVLTSAACSSGPASAPHDRTSHSTRVGPALAGVGTLPPAASAWPAAGYDARHSSATGVTGPQGDHVRWTRALGGDATPGPVLAADGTVLAATQSGVLHDLDPATGRDVWTFHGGGSYGTDLSTSPAVLAGGTILWPGPADTLFAVSPAGRLLWSEHFSAQVLSPAIAGLGRVYVADLSGRLSAIEVSGATHRLLWTLQTGGTDYAAPTVGPDGTVYTAADDDVVAVRDTGRVGVVLARFHARKMVEVSTAVAPDGTVLVGTNHDKEFGLSANADVRWAVDIGDYTYSSSVVRPDGTAAFGDNMGRLRLVAVTTGRIERTIAPLGVGREKIWSEPVLDARGDVYWATNVGNVWGYDRTGRQLLHVRADSGINSYPALGGDGTLYVGSTGGTLYAIGAA